VTIVKADSRGIVRHIRMQVRDAFSLGYFAREKAAPVERVGHGAVTDLRAQPDR
jgi:hypothetical protein